MSNLYVIIEEDTDSLTDEEEDCYLCTPSSNSLTDSEWEDEDEESAVDLYMSP